MRSNAGRAISSRPWVPKMPMADFARRNDIKHSIPKERREQTAAGAENDQIVVPLCLIEQAGS